MEETEIFAHIPSANMGGSTPGVPGVLEDRFRQIADTLDAFGVHENGRGVSRVQRAGLEIEKAHDLGKVVRVLGDELEDMGLQFEAVGLQVIDE